MKEETGQIEIYRIPNFSDSARAYQVFINGTRYGYIENGHKFRCKLEPGEHLIHLKCDWLKTPQTEFQIRAGEKVFFECGVNVGILKKLWMALLMIWSERTWFYIKRVDG